MDAKELFTATKVTLGNFLSKSQVISRYDVFHVEDLRDKDGNPINYELTAPATLYRNAGFQNSTQPADFSLRMSARQFVVGGVAHWPFEALNIQLDVEPVYHEFATELARKAFGGRVLGRLRYGVMPGRINYIDGNPVFTIDPDHADGALFYADQPMTAFAAFRSYNCVKLGAVDILLLPIAIANQLVA